MVMNSDWPDDEAIAAQTREVVLRYHLAWKERDLERILALYHPKVQYFDFFLHKVLGLAELRDYVQSSLPARPGELLEHIDRIRVDGHTAFIQYQIRLKGSAGLVSFHNSEAISVCSGKIIRIREYAVLEQAQQVRPQAGSLAQGAEKLGLSARQLSVLAEDLADFFQKRSPYLDPALDLSQVAQATGYSRNQISFLLNQVLGQSFYRYVNQARLQHLLAQLDEGSPARIDALAFAAGFNSLSAFYKCFRQHTGLAPAAYIKQLKNSTRARE